MRILVLSFYFEPDLCAGSFRATALAEAISGKTGEGDEVHVLTTMPNRYRSYKVKPPKLETRGNIHIRRIPLPPHRSGMVDQGRAFFTYASAVMRQTVCKRYDIVFATSSRLMTAVLGALIAKCVHAPLYLDIRDIFSDTLSDVFDGKPQRLILPLLRMAEKWTIARANRINLVSGGFTEYFQRIRKNLKYRTFTNGIDEVFLGYPFDAPRPANHRRIVLYAGNIGEGQGLERIIPDAAPRLKDDFDFWVIGDGGRRPQLEALLRKKRIDNVRLMDPVPRENLAKLYALSDVLFLHLNDYPAFHKVLPSKIFEYAVTGKPILAGVKGYARRFIQDHVRNATIFDPCDHRGLEAALGNLDFSMTRRERFVSQFTRASIIKRLADDVLEMADVRTWREN